MPRNERARSPGSDGARALLGVFLVTGASCATGRRVVASLPHLPKAREIDAASACEFLTRQNFPYVSHVVGGISAWIQGGYGRSTGSP